MLLHGILPPITTPFYPDGQVYYKKLEHNVERFSRTPVAGIVVLGSTGEALMLSDQERRDVLKVARQSAAPNKVLIAGTGIESAIETLRLTEYAAELGYDVAMVRTPHYYKKQMLPANMLAFYRTVADRSPLPVIIYNFPQATGYDIPAEVVIELAEHPNLIGIKESSGDVEKVRKMVEATRHIKRSATVTETFDAVTSRMLAGAAGSSQTVGELIPVGALSGGTASQGSDSHFSQQRREVGHPVSNPVFRPVTKDYFSVFTYSATALASSAESPAIAFLCGAFFASWPLVSRSVICSVLRLMPFTAGPIFP